MGGSSNEGYSENDYMRQEKALRATYGPMLRKLLNHLPDGDSLLDVGCGYGFLLAEAKKFFKRVEGLELSTEAASKAHEFVDKIHTCAVDDLPKDCFYSTIVATQVIEHIYEPQKFVASLISHLKPGGVLLLSTPDMGSFWRRLMGSRWYSFKVPEHVIFYDVFTLGKLMKEAGLVGVAELPYWHAFPLELVCAKLGIWAPAIFANVNIWIPRTTVCVIGRKSIQ